MLSSVKGVLITTYDTFAKIIELFCIALLCSHGFALFFIVFCRDVATKQLILFLDRENQRSQGQGKGRIVLKDLDDKHVLIDAAYVSYVKKEVERLYDQNTYDRSQLS